MAFVNAETGKQIKLEKGYLSKPVDYQTFVKQQEAKRQSAAPAPAAATAQKAKGTASRMNWAEGSPSAALSKGAASPAAARNRVEGLPSARPSVVSLENQKRQAQVDQDTDAILRLNKQLKEERARRGRQTLGDRVSDVASAVFGGSGGSFANLAGFTSNLFQDPEADRRSIARAQEALRTGRTSDGRPINDAQRKTLEESIARLSAHAAKLEAPDSFTNRAYRAADRMADTGAAFQESAKQGLGGLGTMVVDAATSAGQSLLDNAVGAATGTGMLPFVARALGGAAQEARRGGADLDEQLLYGSAQAAKEYIGEMLFGLSAPQRLIGGGSFDDAIEKGIRNVTERLAKTPAGQKAVGGLLTWLAGGATEGLEEGIGSVIENTLINPNLRDWDPDTRSRQQKFEEALYDMLVGGVSGLMGVTNLAQYQVSPADAHVRRTLDMMNRAAGRETAKGGAQEAAGARFEAGKDGYHPRAKSRTGGSNWAGEYLYKNRRRRQGGGGPQGAGYPGADAAGGGDIHGAARNRPRNGDGQSISRANH